MSRNRELIFNPQTLMERFNRDFIGMENLARHLFEDTGTVMNANGYPPFNIEIFEDGETYQLTLAVAGFGEDDITITTDNGVLVIEGRKADDEEENRVFLHKGIANRAFKRQFHLAEYVEVKGANLKDGILTVDMKREVPEAMKPKTIPIGGSDSKVVDAPKKRSSKAK